MTGHILQLGVLVHACDPSTWGLGYKDHSEFEANLGYSGNISMAVIRNRSMVMKLL